MKTSAYVSNFLYALHLLSSHRHSVMTCGKRCTSYTEESLHWVLDAVSHLMNSHLSSPERNRDTGNALWRAQENAGCKSSPWNRHPATQTLKRGCLACKSSSAYCIFQVRVWFAPKRWLCRCSVTLLYAVIWLKSCGFNIVCLNHYLICYCMNNEWRQNTLLNHKLVRDKD